MPKPKQASSRNSRRTKEALPRLTKEPRRLDPYRTQTKPANTPECPTCKAINIKGSWIAKAKLNGKAPFFVGKDSPKKTILQCPACKQLHDKYAAGVVELHGDGLAKNRANILKTVAKTEKIARSRNDQQRVLWTKETDGVLKIYVSLPELARQIGRELEKSFKGTAEYSHSTEESYLRVKWWSDSHKGHEPGAPLEKKRKPSAPKSRSFRGRGRVIPEKP